MDRDFELGPMLPATRTLRPAESAAFLAMRAPARAMAGKKALTILSVSDNVVTHEELTPQERQTGLRNMIELALNITL